MGQPACPPLPCLPCGEGAALLFLGAAVMLDNFRVGKFRFVIEPTEPVVLPEYKGSALRAASVTPSSEPSAWSGMANAIAASSDPGVRTCTSLRRPRRATPNAPQVPGGPPSLCHRAAPGRPSAYTAGDRLEFGITLIGRGIDYLPYFIVSFEELSPTGLGHARGKFRLAEGL